jgi:ribosomal protein S18 acetylase RimI-like enzyme
MKVLQLNTRFDGESAATFVGIECGALVAQCLLYYKNGAARIESLFVSEQWRQRGFARQLINECKATARERGCVTLGLVVTKKNTAARKAYDRLGFMPAFQWDDGDTLLIVKL